MNCFMEFMQTTKAGTILDIKELLLLVYVMSKRDRCSVVTLCIAIQIAEL